MASVNEPLHGTTTLYQCASPDLGDASSVKKSPLDLDINRSANSIFNSIKYEYTFDDP